MPRGRPTALLIDLDGVLRRFDAEFAAGVERRYGLPAGALFDTAMRWSLLQPAVSGQVNHTEWMDNVVEALAEAAGGRENARAAVDEWQTDRGEIDGEVLAFIREVRSAGVRVGLATNATDRLDADLAALGVADDVDLVLNSSVLGVHKPVKDYFRQACLAVGAPPERVLFVDDSDRAVRGARAAGLSAHRWTGPGDLPYLRAVLVR